MERKYSQKGTDNVLVDLGFEDAGELTVKAILADALSDGRLVRLSPLSITYEQAQSYHLVYPPGLRDWPPLASLRNWLRDEFDLSRKLLHPDTKKRAPKTPKR